MPLILILGVLLGSGYFLGRIFCGYACPLGAIQELMSKFRFKTKAKVDPNPVKAKLNRKRRNSFRWLIFLGYIVGTAFLGGLFAKISNPFVGFQAIKTGNFKAFLVPLIFLIVVIATSVFVYRPYCRYFCPYGAFASVINRGEKISINFGNGCKDCGLCDRACPTNSLDQNSDKSECYYCGRCLEICVINNSKADQDLLDNQKIAEINQILTVAKLYPHKIEKRQFVDSIIKLLIGTFPHSEKKTYFEELRRAISEGTNFSILHVQKVLENLRAFADEELKALDFDPYYEWIKRNSELWKNQYTNSSQLISIEDKIFYGKSLKTKKDKGETVL